MNPTLSKIRIYPIKSLDPVNLDVAMIGHRSLLNDRIYAMIAEDGKFINGKKTGLVNQLKAEYNEDITQVTFSRRGSPNTETFHFLKDTPAIEKYLTTFFGTKISLIKNEEGKLMDIPDISSLTVVARETIILIAHEFGEDEDTMRLRFRTNIEISSVPPFWEEHLANPTSNKGIEFKIGEVNLIGISLRARCNVPPRNPLTGETDKTFIKKMMHIRENTIPAWSHVKEYGSVYHLTVDTLLPDNNLGKKMKVGDEVEIISERV